MNEPKIQDPKTEVLQTTNSGPASKSAARRRRRKSAQTKPKSEEAPRTTKKVAPSQPKTKPPPKAAAKPAPKEKAVSKPQGKRPAGRGKPEPKRQPQQNRNNNNNNRRPNVTRSDNTRNRKGKEIVDEDDDQANEALVLPDIAFFSEEGICVKCDTPGTFFFNVPDYGNGACCQNCQSAMMRVGVDSYIVPRHKPYDFRTHKVGYISPEVLYGCIQRDTDVETCIIEDEKRQRHASEVSRRVDSALSDDSPTLPVDVRRPPSAIGDYVGNKILRQLQDIRNRMTALETISNSTTTATSSNDTERVTVEPVVEMDEFECRWKLTKAYNGYNNVKGKMHPCSQTFVQFDDLFYQAGIQLVNVLYSTVSPLKYPAGRTIQDREGTVVRCFDPEAQEGEFMICPVLQDVTMHSVMGNGGYFIRDDASGTLSVTLPGATFVTKCYLIGEYVSISGDMFHYTVNASTTDFVLITIGEPCNSIVMPDTLGPVLIKSIKVKSNTPLYECNVGISSKTICTRDLTGKYTALDHGAAYAAAMRYVTGKTFTSSSMATLASITNKHMTSPAQSAAIHYMALRDSAVSTRNWTSLAKATFLAPYRWIKRYNETISQPFGEPDFNWLYVAGGVAFAACMAGLATKLAIDSRKNSRVPVSAARALFSVSASVAPRWLLVAYAKQYLMSKINQYVYGISEFTYKYSTITEGQIIPVPYTNFESHCNFNRELKEIDETASVEIDYSSFRCNPGFGNMLYGLAVHGSIPLISRTCTHNSLVAVTNRACKSRVTPKTGSWKKLRLEADELVELNNKGKYVIRYDGDSYIKSFDGYYDDLKPHDFDKWLRHLSSTSRKQIIRAHEENKPLSPPDLMVKAFVKKENVLKFSRTEEDYDPRLISGRTPNYQLHTGPITYAVSKRVASVWNASGRIVYAAGMTAEQISNWFDMCIRRYRHPVIIEADASRWDSSVSIDALKLEMYVYKKLGVPKKFLNYLKKQYETEGRTPDGIHYKVSATRKSGDGNTSVGNSVLNGLMTSHILNKYLKDWRMIVMGDDVLVICKCIYDYKTFENVLAGEWLKYGFQTRVNVFDDIQLAQFCSSRFYPVEGGYRFAPKIGRLFCKIGFCKDRKFKLLDVLVHSKGVALGLRETAWFLPLVGAYLINLSEIDVEAPPIKETHKFYAKTIAQSNESTYTMVEHVYGVSKYDLYELEDKISRSHMPSIICSELITRMIDIDASDYRIPAYVEFASTFAVWEKFVYMSMMPKEHLQRDLSVSDKLVRLASRFNVTRFRTILNGLTSSLKFEYNNMKTAVVDTKTFMSGKLLDNVAEIKSQVTESDSFKTAATEVHKVRNMVEDIRDVYSKDATIEIPRASLFKFIVDGVINVIAVPIVEESFRSRKSFKASAIITGSYIGLETLSMATQGHGFFGSLINRTVVHGSLFLINRYLGCKAAVVAHMAYNAHCLYIKISQ